MKAQQAAARGSATESVRQPKAGSRAPKTLVFPGGETEALRYRRETGARGEALIGASSLLNDPARGEYDHWVQLPSIYDEDFADRLRETIERYDVGAVFCTHSLVHDRVQAVLQSYSLPCRMANPHPVELQQSRIRDRLEQARALLPYMSAVAGTSPQPSELEVAGLLQASGLVPGQSDDTKLATLMALFPSLPRGDVVEVGVYWGRSAFALAWLAARHEVGSVLAVDPWAADEAVQREAPEALQREAFRHDWETVHSGFLMHTLPVAPGRLGYLRAPSQDAARRYPNLRTLRDALFGPVRYKGRIALLHIDGNHDYEAAHADLSAWTPFVQPRGWIVLDDYVWMHGDGPQRAGNELLDELGQGFARAFVAGDALFLQLA